MTSRIEGSSSQFNTSTLKIQDLDGQITEEILEKIELIELVAQPSLKFQNNNP